MTHSNEEASELGDEMMDIEVADANKGCITQIKENVLLLWPVSPQECGEGLPYAPVDWPSPGDTWGWRVGKRVANSGYYLDRYLYLPMRFQKSNRKRDGFASKLSVENYFRAKFPGADVKAFFSSFSWRVPTKQSYLLKDEHGALCLSSEDMLEHPNSMSGVAVCKAGNRYCSSLVKEEESQLSDTQSCDVCCSEPSFCRVCCCILCCNTLDIALGGYSFIRCEATASDGSICDHAAHVNCALRSYMAGTVGGTIGLDTEYYCRRCDTRIDLTEHVKSLLKTCDSIGSRDDIKKILSMGFCILRGSNKSSSQKLLNHIESILHKLKTETELKDVWRAELDVDVVHVTPGEGDDVNYTLPDKDENNFQHENLSLKFNDEINQVLKELGKSQEQEFRIAEENLLALKDYLLSLQKDIENEKNKLVLLTPSSDRDALISSLSANEEHLKHELFKFKDMEKIANGFGRTPKTILKDHFGIDLED